MPDPKDWETLKETFGKKIRQLYPAETRKLPGRFLGAPGPDDNWCFKDIGDKVADMGEPRALAAIEAMCQEVGLSRAMTTRVLDRAKQRFAEATGGQRWTTREIKDTWKAAVAGKERYAAEAAIDFAVMCAFRSD